MAIEISLIIPTRDRKQELSDTLSSVINQSFPRQNFEVIIIDDGSRVRVDELINKFRYKGLNIFLLKQERKGPAVARNLGIRNARGKIIAFTDDDCSLSPQWLENMYSLHKAYPDVMTIGGNTQVKVKNCKAIISQFMTNGAIWAKLNNGKKEIIFFPTCNVSLKREVFNKILFNPKIPYPGGEDLEFFWQLYLKRYKFMLSEQTQVFHLRKFSFIDFLRQPYIYGKGNFLVQRRFPQHFALSELKSLRKILMSIVEIPLFSLYLSHSISKKYHLSMGDKIFSVFYLVSYRSAYFIGYMQEKFKSILCS